MQFSFLGKNFSIILLVIMLFGVLIMNDVIPLIWEMELSPLWSGREGDSPISSLLWDFWESIGEQVLVFRLVSLVFLAVSITLSLPLLRQLFTVEVAHVGVLLLFCH